MSMNRVFAEEARGALAAAVGVILVALVACTMYAARLPAPAPADAAPSAFSAMRAFAQLEHIANEPHAIGTAANEQVRHYIADQLRAAGLEPQEQTATVQYSRRGQMVVAVVHNLVARKAGAAPDHASRPALMLATHYDSVRFAPGAGDSGTSVAAMLETARALKNGPALENDVIFLITDGEEAGLLGARGFAAEHPWAKDVGLVLNFDSRGNRGPFLMFETSNGNSAWIADWAHAAPHALGTSLMYEAFKLMPNDTDMTVFKRAGMAGLNFANVEGLTDYHTALDTTARLDKGSLQQDGEAMLALTRHFGQRPLTKSVDGDDIYFDLPGLGVIHYGEAWVWPLTVLVVLLCFGVCKLALSRNQVTVKQLVQSSLGFVLIAAAMCGAGWCLWQLMLLIHPGYRAMVQGTVYNEQWYLLAFVALALLVYTLLQRLLQNFSNTLASTLGAMLFLNLLLIGASAKMPGASYLFAWPLLAVQLSYLVLWSGRAASLSHAQRVLIMTLGVVPAAILFTPVVRGIYIVLTPNNAPFTIIFLALAFGMATPLLATMNRRFAVTDVALLTLLGALITGGVTGGFSASQPRPDKMMYALDGASGKAYWISTDSELDAWTRLAVPDQTEAHPLPEIFGANGKPVWSAGAPDFGIAAPKIALTSDTTKDGVRHVEVSIASANQAPEVEVWVEGLLPTAASFNGQRLMNTSTSSWTMFAYGEATQTMALSLDVAPGKPFKIHVTDHLPGLPKNGLPPRPADLTPQLGRTSNIGDALSVLSVN